MAASKTTPVNSHGLEKEAAVHVDLTRFSQVVPDSVLLWLGQADKGLLGDEQFQFHFTQEYDLNITILKLKMSQHKYHKQTTLKTVTAF